MNDLELQLQKHGIYGTDAIHEAPIKEILKEYKLRKLSAGNFSRAFRIDDTPWVVKEGRWDLDLDIVEGMKLKLPAELTERALSLFSFYFLPNEDEILRQYHLFFLFMEYFGCFMEDEDYFHPDIENIVKKQRAVRERLLSHKEELERYHWITFPESINSLLESELVYYNFLPKEYLLYGEPVSPENDGKSTSYIFQQFVDGKMLYDLKIASLPNEVKKQFALFCYLILLLKMEKNVIPDTRPRYPFVEMADWVGKTDNIIVGTNGMKFIDTRWLWNPNDNFIKRGLLIPDMIISSAKWHLLNILKDVGH